ncbi:nitrite reductase [NAD(P)H], large subunit [Enterococcus haemoperoxidus ATCC BAA-382]|uniref:Nitrite reductase [NAD(P)H], large subunit n=1 Tax=Enterococcus haemoperoxidus ATCC BAA-382 TaxID=1158608 RepID=R2SZA8_9ENTE|nr:nitrite reductase large subunit NirB [Enterococcus haemoperoxidus]EOH93364.1 nitrite reductase [NAD(P)H], large subunit [Enterococcus haemoperoxidus ATCC BAA-382]EOT61318.1 nitrite reductase [NAD(P)H], large subunit [Enterococcus haemoperoxidus ATCC BAA-382]OJG54500.1 nitrite reductase [Enterococcus haemoperoxidus]
MKEKLVLIGNGMAGVRTIEEILDRDPERYQITIIGEEKYPNYNRIMLSNVLQKKMSVSEIITNPIEWYEENQIKLINHDPAVKMDTDNKKIITQSGKEIFYDKCILATGSRAFILPIEGAQLPGVVGFRTIDDTENMLEASQKYQKAVVIGGGLLGLEAAKGLLDQGMDVTVIHLEKWLMETQLDEKAGKMLQADLEKQGLKFLMEKATQKILGETRVTGLAFSDGTTIETDMVVMSIGIRSETTLARTTTIEVNRGIVVDDFMKTTVPDVFAVGECAEHNGNVYGLVAPLFEQGKVLADVLTGKEAKPYQGSTTFTSLKVSGCDLYSAGNIRETEGINSIEAFDGINYTYKKIFVRENQVVGVVLYGDTSEGNRYYNILKKNESIEEYTPVSLLHMVGEEASADVSEWPDDEVICGCNGIDKGTIMTAINEKDLTSVADVTKHTKAGGSCGKCKSVIGDVLAYALGGEVVSAPTGICGCTDLSRDQIVTQIYAKKLTSSDEVYRELNFTNPEGCPKCRPAVNFYLNVAWPKEHADEKESRYVNERLYANIQNDGTFSVIPRMRGGKTNPQQLLLIAKVAEKYDVPMVKVTGSQRIGLYGVKKEDLPKIWEELDMKSAGAYAKAVRSVKTCVGANFCRFGTQDSMGLGIKLEQRYEFIDTPHKFKMGVSACPRSCVESGVKDFGIIGVDNGFQIYVGGNGGTEIKEAVLLTTVETEQEVIDICGAMLQYYRETGIYAERTAPWIERMGFDVVKEVLLDPEKRQELLSALDEAVIGRRGNPWDEVVEDNNTRQELYTVGRV